MITIVGPREWKKYPEAINTTSSASGWSRGLSPFILGPVTLYNGMVAKRFENLWQFAKLYTEHVNHNGEVTQKYWDWAKAGWNSEKAIRYPMGKGKIPLCSLWEGERLGYIEARKKIYIPFYRDLVKKTDAFFQLQERYRRQGDITLFDFDGYDYRNLELSLGQVLVNSKRKMGHAFVLAMMLEYGVDFKIENLK